MPKMKRLSLGQRTTTGMDDTFSDVEDKNSKATECSIFIDKDGKAREICQSDTTINTGLMIQPLAEQHLSLSLDSAPVINAVTSPKAVMDDYSSWINKATAQDSNKITERSTVSESHTVTEKKMVAKESRAAIEKPVAQTLMKEAPSAPAVPQAPAAAPVQPSSQEQKSAVANDTPAAAQPPTPPAKEATPQVPEKKAEPAPSAPATPDTSSAPAAPPVQANVIVAKPPVVTPEQLLEQEMTKLVEAEKKLGSDLPTLHELYLKGIIDKDAYERSKASIDVRYMELEQKLKNVTEKSQLEQLKRRINQEIESVLLTPQFEETNKQLLAEAAKLDELFNDGIIDKKIYDEKKMLIQQKLNRIKTLESKIVSAFDVYVQEFARKEEDHEADKKQLLDKIDQELEENLKPKPAVVEQKPKEQAIEMKPLPSLFIKHPKLLMIANKAGFFKTASTAQEVHTAGGLHEEMQKIETIRKKQNDEFALINTVLLVKRQLLQRLNIQKEMTYTEVLDMLPKTAMDHDVRERLVRFFSRYLENQYVGAMTDNDFNEIWAEGNKILTLLQERVKPVVAEVKKK